MKMLTRTLHGIINLAKPYYGTLDPMFPLEWLNEKIGKELLSRIVVWNSQMKLWHGTAD